MKRIGFLRRKWSERKPPHIIIQRDARLRNQTAPRRDVGTPAAALSERAYAA